jgi:hypothetical protein
LMPSGAYLCGTEAFYQNVGHYLRRTVLRDCSNTPSTTLVVPVSGAVNGCPWGNGKLKMDNDQGLEVARFISMPIFNSRRDGVLGAEPLGEGVADGQTERDVAVP